MEGAASAAPFFVACHGEKFCYSRPMMKRASLSKACIGSVTGWKTVAAVLSVLLAGCAGFQERPHTDYKETGEYTCRAHGGLLKVELIYTDPYGEKVIFTCKEGMSFENMIDYPKPPGVF